MKDIKDFLRIYESAASKGISIAEYAAAYVLENIDKAKKLLSAMNDSSAENVLYIMSNYIEEVSKNTPFDDKTYYNLEDYDVDYILEKMKGVQAEELLSKITPKDRDEYMKLFLGKIRK